MKETVNSRQHVIVDVASIDSVYNSFQHAVRKSNCLFPTMHSYCKVKSDVKDHIFSKTFPPSLWLLWIEQLNVHEYLITGKEDAYSFNSTC